MKVKVTEYNIHNGAIRWRILDSVKVMWRIFTTSITIWKILKFQICDFENFEQGHEVEHLQWTYSIANIHFYKSHNWAFFADSRRFRDTHISNFVTMKM